MKRIILILDRLRSAHNVGNIFRLAEALDGEIAACGYTPAPPHPKLPKSAMGTELTVPCHVYPDAPSAIAALRAAGVKQILAVECDPRSVEAWQFNDYQSPLALVVGNEAHGIEPGTLDLCDGIISLPMFGAKASINVGNALAAVLYAIASKRRGA